MNDSDKCDINLFLEEIKKNRTELKHFIEASENRLLMKIEEFNEKVKKLENENQNLQNKVEILEREIKKNSVLIYGLEVQENNTSQTVCDKLCQLLEIDISPADIKECYWLSIPKKPLKLDLVSNHKKREIFNNCRKLKGTNIGISNDLTYKQRQEYKILRHHLNIARQNKKKSHIKGNKLYIENEVYTMESLPYLNNKKSIANSQPSTPTSQRILDQEELPDKREINRARTSQRQLQDDNKGAQKTKNTTQNQKKNLTKIQQVAVNNGTERLRSHNTRN